MVRAVDEEDANTLHGRTCELAARHRLLDPLVDCGAEALRDDAADDLVHELIALVARNRLEDDVAVAELAAAARLLLVAALRARLLPDGLQVRNARLVKLDVHPEAALDPFDRNLDVHLRHPREQLLTCLLVSVQDESRILLGEASQSGGRLLLVALRLRGDGERHDRLGKLEAGYLDRLVGGEEEG